MSARPIKDTLIAKLTSPSSDTYEEFTAHSTVADVVNLTDKKFRAFEIKGPADNLSRFISFQRYLYLLTFDECWLVVDPKHLDKANELLRKPVIGDPDCVWGLMTSDLVIHKKAKPNKGWPHNDLFLWERLWKADCLREAKILGIPKYSRMSACELRRELLALPVKDEVRPLVRKYTKLHKQYKESGSKLLYGQWLGRQKIEL